VENYDGSFALSDEVSSALSTMLLDASLSAVVAKQANCGMAEYTGELFQPVPFSKGTPHGMPAEMEKYHNKDGFCIINVPPTIMFKARCSNPARLCAVFRVFGEADAPHTTSNPKTEWSDIGDAFRNPVEMDSAADEALDGRVL